MAPWVCQMLNAYNITFGYFSDHRRCTMFRTYGVKLVTGHADVNHWLGRRNQFPAMTLLIKDKTELVQQLGTNRTITNEQFLGNKQS